MEKVKRISASIPSELLADFEALLRENAMPSRSKAIADAMRDFIAKRKWKEEKGVKAGVIAILFNHTVRGTTEKVTDVQHLFHHEINSNTHLHLDEKNCMEVIIVKGSAKKINSLASKLQALRGVNQAKLIKVTL